jgi:hypothetical protein
VDVEWFRLGSLPIVTWPPADSWDLRRRVERAAVLCSEAIPDKRL